MRRGRGAPGATDAVGAARTVNLPTAVCVHVDGNGRRSAMWHVMPGHVDGNDHPRPEDPLASQVR